MVKQTFGLPENTANKTSTTISNAISKIVSKAFDITKNQA
jgi:hypothetical protein